MCSDAYRLPLVMDSIPLPFDGPESVSCAKMYAFLREIRLLSGWGVPQFRQSPPDGGHDDIFRI